MQVSVAEYARMAGVSPQAIRKAIKDGRLLKSVTQDGRSYVIDPALADKEYNRNTAIEQRRTAEQINAGKARARGEEVSEGLGVNYSKARAYGEGFKAKLLELEYREKAGQLTRTDDVKNATFKVIRLFRDAVQNIPIRVVNELAAVMGDVPPEKRHDMMLIMQREIDRALEQLADSSGPH